MAWEKAGINKAVQMCILGGFGAKHLDQGTCRQETWVWFSSAMPHLRVNALDYILGVNIWCLSFTPLHAHLEYLQ